MNHAFDARLQFDKRAKIGDPRHLAAHAFAGDVLPCDGVPRMRLQLLHAQRNALSCRLDLQHLRVNLLSHRQHVGRLVDASPGDIADVQQTIDSADIDERAVVHQAAHRAGDDIALPDLGVAPLLRRTVFLLGDGAAIHHHVLLRCVQLDDAAANLLSHQLFHLGCVTRPAARTRHERAHSHIDGQATLHDGRHGAGNDRLVGKRLLQRAPVLGLLHPQPREFVVALFVAPLHRDLKLISRLRPSPSRSQTATPAARPRSCSRYRRRRIRPTPQRRFPRSAGRPRPNAANGSAQTAKESYRMTREAHWIQRVRWIQWSIRR